jgi:anaerobic selenocysteine-containing dehydrogenase
MTEHSSFCRLCLNGCAIRVEIEDGRAVKISGDKTNPIYRGFTCVKGREQAKLLADPRRLRHSLKRDADGVLRPIPSTQAITEIAARLTAIRDQHGPRAIAGYLGTFFAASAATMPLFGGFMQAIGSPMAFSPGTIDKPGKKIAQALHGDWAAPAVGFDDPEVILLVGINPLVTFTGFPYGNPGKWLNERLASGTRLIVIDPRRSDVARRAHIHIQPKPGQDAPIIAAILRIILEQGDFDRDFAERYTEGLEELRAAVAPFTPDRVAAMADIPAEQIEQAATALAATRRGYIMGGTGPNMSGAGTLIEYLLLNLHTLCGYWLREGDRVRHPGALAAPLKPRAQVAPPTPAYGFGEKLRVRGLTNTAAGMPTAALPDEILLEGPGQVRALISCGGNPVGAWPDQRKTIRAMQALDLLVQIDPWMSQTSKLADYVIAPRIWLEVAGTSQVLDWLTRNGTGYGQSDPYAQYSPAVADPPEGADLVEEWEFFYLLAREMGLSLSVSPQLGPDMPAQSLDMAVKPSTDDVLDLLCHGSRVPLDAVKARDGGAVFPDPPLHVAPGDSANPHRFQLADAAMIADLAATLADAPGEERPFRLVCRRMMHVYNSSFVGALPPSTRPYNPAFLNPADMAALNLADGDRITIESDSDAIPAIAHGDETLRRGLVSISFGFGGLPHEDHTQPEIGSNPTRLLSADRTYDRYSGQPLMTNVAVSIRRGERIS